MVQFKNIACILLTLLTFINLNAQEQEIQQHPDTIQAVLDSTLTAPTAHKTTEAAKDTVKVMPLDSISVVIGDKVKLLEQKTFKPDPKKAVIYSAIFPGLGQIYNKKYWKLPILYGGFVGVSYAITWNNSHYVDYLEGYRSILKDDPNDPEPAWVNLLPYGRDPDSVDKKWFTGVLKDRKNYFRYYRDLSIIIGVALYGLAMVDAYVDAQLFEFDVSNDLSMRIEPMIQKKGNNNNNNMGNYLADSYGFKLSISF